MNGYSFIFDRMTVQTSNTCNNIVWFRNMFWWVNRLCKGLQHSKLINALLLSCINRYVGSHVLEMSMFYYSQSLPLREARNMGEGTPSNFPKAQDHNYI